MGAIIVVAIVSGIFFLIYVSARKEHYGYDYVKDLPEAEGTITMVTEDERYVSYYVEFSDGNRLLVGNSINYVNPDRKYWKGDKVKFWYKIIKPGNCYDARIVLQDTELVSSEKKGIEKSWQILVFAIGFAIFDVILIIWNIFFYSCFVN